MSRTTEPVTNRKFVTVLVNLAVMIAVVLGGSAGVSARSTPITRPAIVNVPVVARVVDGNGRAQRAATVIACPYVGAASDCTHAITEPVGLLGFAVLSLNKDTRYSVFAFVKNPSPAWECPGYPIGNDVLYISPEFANGTPKELPLVSTFTVAKPGPYDCVTVKITDDAGNPLPGAGVHVDGGPSGSGPADSSGTVRFKATPGQMYDVEAFISNSGWPCPSLNQQGTPYHYSEHRIVSAEDLLAGVTLVIHKPDPSECAPVPKAEIRMVDESGAPLPAAFVGTCGYDASTPPVYAPDVPLVCSADSGWRGPDGDGVIRIDVADPSLMYNISGYLSCTNGWFLFSEFNNTSNGYTFWTISGADLLANGLELTIVGDVDTCVAPVPV